MVNNSEIDALIKLLDDNDPEVFNNVSQRLISLGQDVVPMLEAAWEDTLDAELHERIEEIIHIINYQELYAEFKEWAEDDNSDLLKGAILVAKFHYPDLSETEVYLQIDKIKQKVWLELNSNLTPLEKINVFNHVFYRVMGFNGSYSSKPETKDYCINAVLESKNGNSISLGIIYLAIAQQLSLPVYGVNLYRHFILGYQNDFIDNFEIDNSADTIFYINSMNKGMVFQKSEIKEYLKNMHQEEKPEFFSPASNKMVIKELLHYLHFHFKEKNEFNKEKKIENLLELFGEN
jgi:regulator of sirC expression with transglutaminase-like and TPR domain